MKTSTLYGLVAVSVAVVVLTTVAVTLHKPLGEQCLELVRPKLKDPASAKIISYESGYLRFTATNSFGGRISNIAMCMPNPGGGFSRVELLSDTQAGMLGL